MRFECPKCKEWPPVADASFCCYCGVRFSDHKLKPAELANNYRKFAIKYFWFVGLPGTFVLTILLMILEIAIFNLNPYPEKNSFSMLAFPIAIMVFMAHFEWWYKRKFPNYRRI